MKKIFSWQWRRRNKNTINQFNRSNKTKTSKRLGQEAGTSSNIGTNYLNRAASMTWIYRFRTDRKTEICKRHKRSLKTSWAYLTGNP